MTSIELVTDTLMLCAEADIDVQPTVYEKFFEACPAARDLMGHSDEHMRGRMLEQVFELLMDPELQGAENYLEWEFNNHIDAYGVDADMYSHFFSALQQAIAGALGERWSAEFEAAWQTRIAGLINEVDAYSQAN